MSTSLRILCITAGYPPHHLGGYEVSCAGVMDGLVARGHHVTVLTSVERIPGVAEVVGEESAAPAVRRRLVRWFRDHQLWSPVLPVRWRVERANQRALAAALADARPDVVAVWHVGALSVGLLTTVVDAGLPVVYAVSDDWPSYCLELDAWARVGRRLGPLAGLAGAVLRVPTAVGDLGTSGAFCFISEDTRRRAEHHGPWTFPDTAIVYSGIDGRLFTPRAAPPVWGWRLLYVGRLDPRKGIDTLVRAVALLPPAATLEVQGTGDPAEEARLQALVAELGLGDRVRVERVLRAELPDRYRAADVCVFPSEWEEPFGLVPIEAMACGTPVVATGTGGSAEFLVDGANCLRYPAGDAAALAAAVTRLAADEALRAELARGGAATAAYFDDTNLTDAFEAWYRHAATPALAPQPPSRRFTLGADRA